MRRKKPWRRYRTRTGGSDELAAEWWRGGTWMARLMALWTTGERRRGEVRMARGSWATRTRWRRVRNRAERGVTCSSDSTWVGVEVSARISSCCGRKDAEAIKEDREDAESISLLGSKTAWHEGRKGWLPRECENAGIGATPIV
jgi:hypothetical protein